jgi:hypothetical protein
MFEEIERELASGIQRALTIPHAKTVAAVAKLKASPEAQDAVSKALEGLNKALADAAASIAANAMAAEVLPAAMALGKAL